MVLRAAAGAAQEAGRKPIVKPIAAIWVSRAIGRGSYRAMSLALLLIVIGIVLAILVHYALGIVVILIGLALLIIPRLSGGGTRRV